MRLVTILLTVTLLSGCFWNEKEPITLPPEQIEKPIYHPVAIRPVQVNTAMEFRTLTPDTHDDVLTGGNYAYQCLTWNDYLILGQNMQAIITKFLEYEGILCYYRRDLKEERCVKFNIPEEKEPEKKGDG